MSNLMSMMLSFVLIFPTILFGADLYMISSYKTMLEARATTLSYEISSAGGMREQMIDSLAESGISFTCLDSCSLISVGETITYKLSVFYTPIIFSREEMQISVTRTTIVGYL